jgi:hypothetical protein
VARTRRAAAHTVWRKSTATRSRVAVLAFQGRYRKVDLDLAKVNFGITDTTTNKRLEEVAFLEEEEKDEMKPKLTDSRIVTLKSIRAWIALSRT